MLLDHHSRFFLLFLAYSDPWSNAPGLLWLYKQRSITEGASLWKKCGLAYSKKFLSKVLKSFSKVIEKVVALRLTIICA